ncbi:MAG: hypothetical protein LAP87_02700 [Acidobacteriia bacterium]|nr:hypothetical protein [Terriglobia bacterium]
MNELQARLFAADKALDLGRGGISRLAALTGLSRGIEHPDSRVVVPPWICGGSNGNRLRAWKLNLQKMADQIQIPITVCPYPPGTSKWNKIEHRLFSFISLNWRGEPLINYETIINLIGAPRPAPGSKSRQCWTRTSMRPESKCLTSSLTKSSSGATKFIRRGTTRSRLAGTHGHPAIDHIIS